MSPSDNGKRKATRASRIKRRSQTRPSPASAKLLRSSPLKATKPRRSKRLNMPEILDAELNVTRNETTGNAFMVNAATGTEGYVVYKKTNITDNKASCKSVMLNHPHSERTLKTVAAVTGQNASDRQHQGPTDEDVKMRDVNAGQK